MKRPFLLPLLLGSLALGIPSPASAQSQRTRAEPPSSRGWPFGPTAADPTSPLTWGMDLYNLGILGAKGWDADRPEPKPRTSEEPRMIRSKGRGSDTGPARFRIKAIFPGGPADRAGLQLGDILVEVGGRSLAKDSLATIAKILTRAETTRGRGRVTLTVERGGARVKLKAEIPHGGRELTRPYEGKGRGTLLRRALDWLGDRQEKGGFAPTMCGRNGAVVMTCLAGLAWLSSGSSCQEGPYRKNLQSAYTFVARELTAADSAAVRRWRGVSWDQTNWAYAHAGIFLGELHTAGPDPGIRRVLQKIATVLLARQEGSGGYAHGPGGVNAQGYLELNILAGFVLSALGLARRAGCAVDQARVDRLMSYLEASSAGGGVGYSTRPGQQGWANIGRTAGAWLGARALGMGRRDFVRRMEKWTRDHVHDVLGGHATLMQHILLAGVAARALGSKATQTYWKALRRDFTLARAPDGSFQPRPWHESLLTGNNNDVNMGQVWTTASWAIVLGAGRHEDRQEGLPGWTGRGTE